CARGGHRFFARVGHARGAFGMECGCDAADVVGTRAGGFALEPRIVCGDEVPVLLLLGIGVGVDAGASGADWRVGSGCPDVDRHGGANFDVGHGRILPCARAAGAAGGMEVFRGWRGGAGREEDSEENRMKSREMVGRVAAFFDLDGTLILRPSLERRFFAELRQRRAIPMRNYFLWLVLGGGVS